MHLYAIPLVFALIGLTLYKILGGADFGAGIWQLLAGTGEHAERVRDHAHESMAPVWEANHVWLVFVLTVVWTAYPTAFASIASTLSIPLFVAAVGIIFRGAAYALRAGTRTRREVRTIDTIFAISSVLTPFALGTAVGAIATGRVPVGNAAGHLVSSWTSPLSIVVGVLAVVTSAYLAAVYLAADAVRLNQPRLAEDFRRRALGAGAVAGVLAVAGLVVLHGGSERIYHRLVDGPGVPALVVSVLAGLLTPALVSRRRFELARYSAAVAVAAIVAGWALAQDPFFLPGLTVRQAAASHDTLVLVVVAVLAGGAILFPSLAALFGLLLRGRLDRGATTPPYTPRAMMAASAQAPLGRIAVALLIVGIGGLTVAETSWAHAVGVVCLLAFVVTGFVAAAPAQVAAGDDR